MIDVVSRVCVGRHNVILASKGVCSFVSSLGGLVRTEDVYDMCFFVIKRVFLLC